MSHRGGPRYGRPGHRGRGGGGGAFDLPPPVQAGASGGYHQQAGGQYNYYSPSNYYASSSYTPQPQPSSSYPTAPPPLFPVGSPQYHPIPQPPSQPPPSQPPPVPALLQPPPGSVPLQPPPAPVIRSHDSFSSSSSSSSQRSITEVLRTQQEEQIKKPKEPDIPLDPRQRNVAALSEKVYDNPRDPRRRNSGEGARRRNSGESSSNSNTNPYDPNNSALEPHMATIRAAVDKVLGLGIRKDIYEEKSFENIMETSGDNIVSYHTPVGVPQPSFGASLDIVEDKDIMEIPDNDSVEPNDEKCEKKSLDDFLVRCNFCPEPGMINIAEKIAHQAQHMSAFFSCAACNGKRKFEEFDELVKHIHSLHCVTDSEMVLETIILPHIEGGLKMFKCGVKNCGKTFSALSEKCLLSHMEAVHGTYYIKVGRGKYILRLCRICGDERPFATDKELTHHIVTGHPPEQFGEKLESDEDGEIVGDTTEVKQEIPDPEVEELSSNLLGNLSKPRSSLPKGFSSPNSNISKGFASPVPGPSSASPSVAKSPAPETVSKKKKEKKSKPKSSSSESDSESSEEEVERRKKKKKKAIKSKKSKSLKLSKEEKKFKKKIDSFSPNELLAYLKEMKTKKKLLKEKESQGRAQVAHAPDPKTTFQETINGKPSHFYCLICSVYTGKLDKWLDHRASNSHVNLYSETKEVALKRFSDLSDIDMQECVISDKKFTVDPAGQCRECLDIFWSQNDHGDHLRDGKCLKLEKQRKEKEVEKQRKEKELEVTRRELEITNRELQGSKKKTGSVGQSASSAVMVEPSPERSPSPNIIWKPLPKAGDKGKKWRPLGYEETRNVYERSPSPDVVPNRERVTNINIPKYLMDGKTAYYICKLCQLPVGNVLAWLEHKGTSEHILKYRNASLTDKMDEVIIARSTSVLFLFGDDCNKCLPCDENFVTNSQLQLHEQSDSHKKAVKRKEISDRDEVRNYGDKFSTLYYCDVCSVSTCDPPSVHLVSSNHVSRVKETTKCHHCPLRMSKHKLIGHVDSFHSDTGFACRRCPAKFATGENLLEHSYLHLRRMIHNYDELVALNLFSMPPDLRKMECGSCPDVFIGQDVSQVTDHIRQVHPDIQQENFQTEIEFSCLFCCQNFFNEAQMNDHVKNRHKPAAEKAPPAPALQSPTTVTKRRVFTESPVTKERQSSGNPSALNIQNILSPPRQSSRASPPRTSRSSPPRAVRSSPPRGPREQISNINIPKYMMDHSSRYSPHSQNVGRQSPPRRASRSSPPRQVLRASPPRQVMRKDRPTRSRSRSPNRRNFRPSSRSPSGRSSQALTGANSVPIVGRRSPKRRNVRSPSRSPSRRSSRSRYSKSRSRSRSRRYSRSRSRSPRRYSRSRSNSRSKRRYSRSRTRSPDYRRGSWSTAVRSRSPSPRRNRKRGYSPPRNLQILTGANSLPMVEELSQAQRLEQKREESKLLNNLKKNLVAKKATLEDDLRGKLECKKIKMLDSRHESVKTEMLDGSGTVRVCPFCVHQCKSDEDLMVHMTLRHKSDMFGCSKCASGLQPAMAWSMEVLLQHLATSHRLNVSISEAISSYVDIPSNLHRINCKLCLPPYLLGTEGFWIGSDLQQNMANIEKHFDKVHGITDKSQVVAKLELACRGCDATYPHSSKVEWVHHVKKNHEKLNRPDTFLTGPTKRCDYCGDNIVQTETIRHIKEHHRMEVFQCKACLEVDPASFPYSNTIKEMMQHMVMKHGDQFSSYYDHMVYPVTLYGSMCSGSKCGDAGMVTAFDAATIGKHLRIHQEMGYNEVGLFYCRCCDRIKEKFKTLDEVKKHIAQRHKSILKWKAANGNS